MKTQPLHYITPYIDFRFIGAVLFWAVFLVFSIAFFCFFDFFELCYFQVFFNHMFIVTQLVENEAFLKQLFSAMLAFAQTDVISGTGIFLSNQTYK